jgi:hypothetical protein
MAKKPTVKVQMADEAEDLPSPEQILASKRPPPLDIVDDRTDADREKDEVDALLAKDDSFHFATPDPAPGTGPAPQTPDTHAVPGLTTYQSRIRIVEAWRYPGTFRDAPEFIDRNWAAYGDYDDERKIEAGPCLRLPANTPTGEKLARKGDYVVRQEIQLTSDLPGDIEVDVWPAEQFERLFIPVAERPTKSFSPSEPAVPTMTPQSAAAPEEAADAGLPLKADGFDSGNGDPHLSTRDGG